MPEAEDDDIEDTNESAKMQVDNTIIKLAEQYAASLRRSATENDERSTIRANAKKIGIEPRAFQQGVSMVKMMDPGERRDHQRGLKRMLSVLSDKVADLFPEDVERQKQRAERRREREANAAIAAGGETPEQQVRRLSADTNPRSKPKDSSAVKPKRRKAPETAVEAAEQVSEQRSRQRDLEAENVAKATIKSPWPDDAAADRHAQEQEAGDALLEGHLDTMKAGAEPESQSAQAAAIRDKLGLA